MKKQPNKKQQKNVNKFQLNLCNTFEKHAKLHPYDILHEKSQASSASSTMLLVSQVVAKSAGFYVMLDPFYELIEQLPAFPCISAAWFPIDLTNHWDEILTVLQRSRYVQPNNPELRLMLRCYSQSYGDIPVGNNIGVRVNGVPVFAPFQANVQQIIMTIIPKPPQTHCSILLDITDYIIAPISFIEVQMQRNIIDLAVVPMLMKR